MGRAAVFSALLLAVAVPAAADQPEAPRVSAGIDLGIATPLHGDFQFNAAAWQASVRAAVARHFLIEAFFGEWRHSSKRVTTDTIVQGPGGVVGSVDRITERTEQVRPGLGFNLLAAGSVGRLTVSGGGGAGMLLYRRHFTQNFEGCHGADLRCGATDTRFSSASFTLQASTGVDVAIAARFAAFGEFRVALPLEDPGSGQTAVAAGLRVTLW